MFCCFGEKSRKAAADGHDDTQEPQRQQPSTQSGSVESPQRAEPRRDITGSGPQHTACNPQLLQEQLTQVKEFCLGLGTWILLLYDPFRHALYAVISSLRHVVHYHGKHRGNATFHVCRCLPELAPNSFAMCSCCWAPQQPARVAMTSGRICKRLPTRWFPRLSLQPPGECIRWVRPPTATKGLKGQADQCANVRPRTI